MLRSANKECPMQESQWLHVHHNDSTKLSHPQGKKIFPSNAAKTALITQNWISPTLAALCPTVYSICPTSCNWSLIDFIQNPLFLKCLWAVPTGGEVYVHIIQILVTSDNAIMCDCNSLNSFILFPATRVMNALICSWVSVMLCHEVL